MGVKVVIRIIVPLVEYFAGQRLRGRRPMGRKKKVQKVFRHQLNSDRPSHCPFDKIIRIHLISIARLSVGG